MKTLMHSLSRLRNDRLILFFFNIFSILFLLVSCTKNDKDKSETLRLALQSEISSIDPSVCYDENCNRVLAQVYETLLEYDYRKRPYTLKPLLADGMPIISEDGLTYTIKIKKNVFYQNTKIEVKAIDFIHAFKRSAFIPTKSKGWWLFNDKIKGLNHFRDSAKTIDDLLNLSVKGLSVLDDYTFMVKLNKRNPQFIYSLAMNFTSPVPKKVITDSENLILETKDIVATGPYKLSKWVKSSKIILQKNQKYRESGLPKIKKVSISIIKEAPTRWLNFISDKIDLLELNKDDHELAFDARGGLKPEFKEKGIDFILGDSLTYWWISFNMNDTLLGKNLKLRQAISHAIDVKKFIKLFTHNLGLKADSIFPPGILGHKTKIPWAIGYDLDKAKQLLREAGYPNGLGLPRFKFDLRNATTTYRQQGEFYKSQLKKIGIDLEVIPNSFPNFLKKSRRGELQIWQDGWIMDYPDPENSLQLLYSANKAPGPNKASLVDAKIDKIYEELQNETNLSKQKKLLLDANKRVQEILPWHMLYYSRYHILSQKRVKNYVYSDVVHNFFKYLELAP